MTEEQRESIRTLLAWYLWFTKDPDQKIKPSPVKASDIARIETMIEETPR